MPSYNLNLTIDAASLPAIRAAGQNIIIAKPVGGSDPNVIWLSFDPFQSNTVTWTEEFGIYASTTALQSGAQIYKMSETAYPAQDGAYYSFGASATFNGPLAGPGAPPAGTYQANNDMPAVSYPTLTFGLQQKATINGRETKATPLNAVTVLATQQVTFTPLTTVFVWLQSNVSSGTILTQVTGKTTIVRFGGSVTAQSLAYDPNTGTFIASDAKTGKPVAHCDHVELRNPTERLFA